ncbi:hypothetical protein SNEBB_009383, partial [Seison nebaliae]
MPNKNTDGSKNIFLYVPNLIGFLRIILLFVSFYFMSHSPDLAITFYLVSGFLDSIDGYAARYFQQGTRFGAMLDMLTDRCATLCLSMYLCSIYPKWMFVIQLTAALDIASHWLHQYSAAIRGNESHKSIDLTANPVLRLYYTSRYFLFFMCAGNELFYSFLYLNHFYSWGTIQTFFGPVTLIQIFASCLSLIAIPKAFISAIHLVT